MEKVEEKTLKFFIEGNSKLLSAMAVLAGLFAFIQGLPVGWLNALLKFLFIGGIILIWFEIQADLPKEKERSLRLYLFSGGISVVTWAMVLYWLLLFRPIWWVCLFFPLTIVFSLLFNASFKTAVQIARVIAELPFINKITRSQLVKDLSNKWIDSKLSKFLDKIYWIVLFTLSLAEGIGISMAVNPILDLINKISIGQ